MGVSAQRNTKGTSQTKISQLQITITINKQVLGLQVTVQNTVAVAVADTLNQLSHKLLDHGVAQTKIHHGAIGKSLAASTLAHGERLHVFLQVKIQEFKDQVQLVAVGVDDVVQLNDVGVAHFFKERDFTNGGTGDTLIFGFETDLLEGNNAVGVIQLTGLVDDTVGT